MSNCFVMYLGTQLGRDETPVFVLGSLSPTQHWLLVVERLAFIGMMGAQLRALLVPLDTIVL